MTNLQELYYKNQQKQLEQQERNLIAQRQQKANAIRKVLTDPDVIKGIEKYLLKFGKAGVKGFGCCCTSGWCSDMKGYETLLNDLVEEWDKKGVSLEITNTDGPSFVIKPQTGYAIHILDDYHYHTGDVYKEYKE